MNWSKIKIVAKAGTEFGILYDEKGEMAIVCRQPGEEWPHGLKPTTNVNQITEDKKAYILISEERFEEWKKKNLSK